MGALRLLLLCALGFELYSSVKCSDQSFEKWTQWSSWGSCSSSCGVSFKIRKRECSGKACSGRSAQTKPCVKSPCEYTPPAANSATVEDEDLASGILEEKSLSNVSQVINIDCYIEGQAILYRGTMSHTESGRTCQMWAAEIPHEHYMEVTYFPDADLGLNNFCRNPARKERPWCFTTDPNVRWEYCNVPVCAGISRRPPVVVPPGTFNPNKDCYIVGDAKSYTGTESRSYSKIRCRPWSSVPKHLTWMSTHHPELPLDEHNFCRSPNDSARPWCYTDSREIEWEYCDIRPCPEIGEPETSHDDNTAQNDSVNPAETCFKEGSPTKYRGTASTTEFGNTCQKWTAQWPHEHSYTPKNYPNLGLGDNNYCRSPNSYYRPWCYTSSPGRLWDYCSVPLCKDQEKEISSTESSSTTEESITISEHITCYVEGEAIEYRGLINVTNSGIECQNWKSDSPHNHYFMSTYFSDKGLGDHNYCRSPDKDSRPWCITVDPKVLWEYCDVPSCSEQLKNKVRDSNEIMTLELATSEGLFPATSAADYLSVTSKPLVPHIDCYAQGFGTKYYGNMSVSESGNLCQPWHKLSLHIDILSLFRNGDKMILQHNYCRSFDNDQTPWCYTLHGNVKWEYCNITVCPESSTMTDDYYDDCEEEEESSTTISSPFLSFSSTPSNEATEQQTTISEIETSTSVELASITESTIPESTTTFTESTTATTSIHPDCYIIGQESKYFGSVSVTKSGLPCRYWALEVDKTDIANILAVTNSDIAKHNYCRSFDDYNMMWCYTSNVDKTWEYCDIPVCSSGEESINITVTPYPTDEMTATSNAGLPSTVVDEIIVPHINCYVDGQATKYNGNISVAESGKPCQSWILVMLCNSSVIVELEPILSSAMKHNYCRSNNNNQKPWCYVSLDNQEKAICDVPTCFETTSFISSTESTAITPSSTTKFATPIISTIVASTMSDTTTMTTSTSTALPVSMVKTTTIATPTTTTTPTTSTTIKESATLITSTTAKPVATTTTTTTPTTTVESAMSITSPATKPATTTTTAAPTRSTTTEESATLITSPTATTTTTTTTSRTPVETATLTASTTTTTTTSATKITAESTTSVTSIPAPITTTTAKETSNAITVSTNTSATSANAATMETESTAPRTATSTSATPVITMPTFSNQMKPNIDCYIRGQATYYNGTISTTEHGERCKKWTEHSASNYQFLLLISHNLVGDHNYCRGIDDSTRPWCLVTNDGNHRIWSYCLVPICPEKEQTTTISTSTVAEESFECYDSKNPHGYQGKQNVTNEGKPCKSWRNDYSLNNFYPGRHPNAGLGDHNYCRNPDKDVKGLWCFISDPDQDWGYCDVPTCSDSPLSTSAPTVEPSTTTAITRSSTPNLRTDNCGKIFVQGTLKYGNKIAGGVTSRPGSIPWQVTLRYNDSNAHFCGGSIISKWWIITAAHCIQNIEKPFLYYGLVGKIFQYICENDEQRVEFSSIFRHENYNYQTRTNDILLLKVSTPIKFTEKVQPICLPRIPPITERMVFMSGWGDSSGTASSVVLRHATFSLLARNDCLGTVSSLPRGSLCAYDINKHPESCVGDGGDPLVATIGHTQYELIGIVSWELGCTEKNSLEVYTEVSYYMEWIENTMSTFTT